MVLLEPVDLASSAAPICRALRTPTMIRSGEAGLTKKSWAPACMALTTVSTPPVAVSTITGAATPRARISFSASEAAHAGHDQVEQDHVGARPPAMPVERRLAALGLGDGEALALQHRLDQAALGRIVVDDAGPSWSCDLTRSAPGASAGLPFLGRYARSGREGSV